MHKKKVYLNSKLSCCKLLIELEKANAHITQSQRKQNKQRMDATFAASKQRALEVNLSAAAPAEPSELMPATVILHAGSTAGTAHESPTLHTIYHLNYFHFHIPMYVFNAAN